MGLVAPLLTVAGVVLQGPAPFGIAAPPGPVATRLAELDPQSPPMQLGPVWAAWEDHSEQGWGAEEPWRRWVELLRAERVARDPSRSAALAELALNQGRDGDAWNYWLEAARSSGWGAALLPLFIPGALEPKARGRREFSDGVLLRPALPPTADLDAGLRQMAGTALELGEFGVGAARCALRVAVNNDGLEVLVRHVAGGAARVRVAAPLPRGVEPGTLLADWERQPAGTTTAEFALDAENNEHSLWLGFRPRAVRWPSPPREQLRALAPGRRVYVVGSPEELRLARLAEALGELLGVDARFTPALPKSAPDVEPLVLELSAGPARERKLAELIGLVEAFVLGPAGR
jgi:hypothetical protein